MTHPLWERPALRDVAGGTLRPGGFTLTDRAARLVGLAPGWRVLDVGCGTGATVQRLRSRYGARAMGIDASDRQLALADGSGVYVQALAEALPFVDASFEMVVSECVLSLCPEPETAMSEFARILVPGGSLVVSDLTGNGTGRCGGSPRTCEQGALPLEALKSLMQQHGFNASVSENHTPLLNDLAAQLLFAGERCACSGTGYCLMIAHKGGL